MNHLREIPWPRIIAEGVAIVVSILLAFAIDAWWDARLEKREETHALEMLDRDITETIAELTAAQSAYERVAEASISAYKALSTAHEELDRSEVSKQISTSWYRRTLRLPRSAYVELISTGDIRVIQGADLRNAIITFYASVEFRQSAFEKNTAVHIDGNLNAVLARDGLFVPYPGETVSPASRLMAERDALLQERLGPQFEHRPHPLWSYGPESSEWDRVRNVLLWNAMGAQTNFLLAARLKEQAIALQTLIRDYWRVAYSE